MKAFHKNEDGTVIVLVALFMTVFIGFLALVVDVGSMYLEKSRLQKITDAALLAGMQEFPANYTKSKEEINKTIKLNDGNIDNFTITTNASYSYLEVVGKRKATFFFAKALGINEPMIEAKARAELHPITSVKGAVPLGLLSSNNLSFGSLQTLTINSIFFNDFFAMSLSGPGADNYETDLTDGYPQELKVGMVLDTEPGMMTGPTTRAIFTRMLQCPFESYTNYSPNCKRVMIVPIIEPFEISGFNIKRVKIVGFATFFLEGYPLGNYVTGRFIRKTMQGASSANQTDFGTTSFKLTR